MKYKILYDYGTYEGNVIDDAEFDTVDEAIQHAVAQNYSTTFRIISIHWEPQIASVSPTNLPSDMTPTNRKSDEQIIEEFRKANDTNYRGTVAVIDETWLRTALSEARASERANIKAEIRGWFGDDYDPTSYDWVVQRLNDLT